MAALSFDNLQVQTLWRILINNRPSVVPFPPDGVLSYTHRLVVEQVRNCLTKYQQGQLTAEYLTDLSKNIRTLLQQAEKRSQIGDLAIIKDLAEKVLSVVEHPARSSERLERAAGDARVGHNVTPETPDPNTGQLELESDLITETTAVADPDDVICEIPEIQESNVIDSLIPARKPRMIDFDISKLIGSGSFGAVYLVHHKDSQKIFAMKKIAKKNLDHPKLVELTYLERDIQTFVDCPFVASMLCCFATKSYLCTVMEYVGGGDCRALLNTRSPLSVPLARLYFAEAVLAVEYLHSFGVIHRDLKPENLLITTTGHIKVTDFGMSKVGVMTLNTNTYKELAEDISREFLDRESCGSPCYISPEVIQDEGYGRPVDWWAMGIMLYEFIVGDVPFSDDSLSEEFKIIVQGHIDWDDHDVPPDAKSLITELLRTNPVERLGTGGAYEIKDHPFLSDLDLDNLLSQTPEYVPQLASAVDTSLFTIPSDIDRHIVSEDEEATSEDNESLDFQNFASSSERLSKLCTTTTKIMSSEDPQSITPCTPPTSGTNILEMQKEHVPVSDRDFAIISLTSSSSSSEFTAQEEGESAMNLSEEQHNSENEEKPKKKRRSIFRRILASCRRGLSRAARALTCCCCCPEVI